MLHTVRQPLRFALLPFVLLACALCLRGQAVAGPQPAAPQAPDTSLRRFEAGAGLADIRSECVGYPSCLLPTLALDLGAAMNLNEHFALDANFNITPDSGKLETNLYGGRVSEVLLGARAELRAKRYGYFLEAQPGVLTWSNVITKVVNPGSPDFSFEFGSRSRFVSNVGGGLEYSPASRIHLRAEVADLVERESRGFWSNNLQSQGGVYVSLGRPLAWKPPVYNPRAMHPFFGPENDVLIAGSVLGMLTDAITTHRFLIRGVTEGDPIAAPLVKYGWSGQISLGLIETGAEVYSMYGLHRIGRHWIERFLPVGIATAHGILAYQNDHRFFRTPVNP
jgi:hypothetical protein